MDFSLSIYRVSNFTWAIIMSRQPPPALLPHGFRVPKVRVRTKELWLVAVRAHANQKGLASIGTPYLLTSHLLRFFKWFNRQERADDVSKSCDCASRFVDFRPTRIKTHLTKKQHFHYGGNLKKKKKMKMTLSTVCKIIGRPVARDDLWIVRPT